MRRVYCASMLVDAHLVKDLLSAEGIDSYVLNENSQGGLGEIPFTQVWPEVWVIEDKFYDRARTVLRNLENVDSKMSFECQSCNELNPNNFETCWNCQERLQLID